MRKFILSSFLLSFIALAAIVFMNIGSGGFAVAQSEPPTCTNGDCSGPPVCSNGDCAPPTCTNGDCTPDQHNCCCVGSNLPGTIRVCCCRSDNLAAINCRESLVLNTEESEFHQTLVDETLGGWRPEKCDALLDRYCNPPVEEICVGRLGRRICERFVKRNCIRLEQVCQYRYCGPEWFPYSKPTPDKDGCEWWDKIVQCAR